LFAFDHALRDTTGHAHLAGLDEAGRGCLAGPVVAACVILDDAARLPGVTDSKQLSPAQRVSARALVLARATAVAWSFVGPRAIDALNIRRASLLAMGRALARARVRFGRGNAVFALVDGVDEVPGAGVPQRSLIEGDGRSLAVAAASIVAKTARDAFMERLALDHPAYGFAQHKGYGTPEHLAALERHGPCAWHRFSYAPVAQISLFAPPLA
jgi:ribonuclease HII